MTAKTEVDDFLHDILPRLRAAETALHSGDARPRSTLWSHNDPVTLFGAEVNHTGSSTPTTAIVPTSDTGKGPDQPQRRLHVGFRSGVTKSRRRALPQATGPATMMGCYRTA